MFSMISMHAWRSCGKFIVDSLGVKIIFGMPKGAKMSLALNKPHEIGSPLFKFKCYLQACTVISAKKLMILEYPLT